jgi:pSer/pThr/pTyr-binding forkhead associated (FHA) protein
MNSGERNLVLRESTVSAAAERITAIAADMEYDVVPTAPRTYRLRRKRRRRLVGSVVETMTIAIVEDRSGVKARITGDLDDVVIKHIGGDEIGDEVDVAPPPTVAPPPAPAPASPHPPTRTEPRARPGVAPTGLIAAVPGSPSRERRVESERPSGPQHNAVERQTPADDADVVEHTVMRSTTRAESGRSIPRSAPVAVLPDGREVELVGALAVGRQPDPSLVSNDAVEVRLADRSVSKTHASIRLDGEDLVVVDLHSSNGTSVEADGRTSLCEPGAPLRTPLRACTIRCGDAPIRIEVGS